MEVKLVLVREFTCSSGRHGFLRTKKYLGFEKLSRLEISAESGTVDFAYVEICAVCRLWI